jgi:NAD dependent epimerase/dehydratase family enzyme
MGQALLLDSARVVPRRLERAGFRFRHPDLQAALRAALGGATT